MSDIKDWLSENGLIATVCNGMVTICDGNCEDCEAWEDYDD